MSNFTRYNNRSILINSKAQYEQILSERQVPFIDQFDTGELTYPTDEQLQQLTVVNEIWGVGSRFYKLAEKHYADPSLWWIIAWFNQKPLETDFSAGDVVMVPTPLSTILNFLGY